MNKTFPVGAKVRIKSPTSVPDWCEWDDDAGRSSTSVKKQLQKKFFDKNTKLSAEVMYIAKESEREALRKKKRIKIRLRDPSGSSIIITADPNDLESA